jgi:hypothetical protein
VKVARPALITYTFAQLPSEEDENAPARLPREGGDGPTAERDYLEGIWDGWQQQLGATQPLGQLGRPTEFGWPEKQWNRRLEIVAAASNQRTEEVGGGPTAREVYEIFLFATHDTAIMIGSLAPNREDDDLDAWRHLYDDWRRRSGDPPETLLGQTGVFLAHLNEPQISLERLDELDQPVHEALPVKDGGRPRWRFNATDRVVFWGVEGGAGEPRLIAALSPVGADETELAELVWWDEHRPYELVPLARYLLNAAKLRFAARVYDRDAEKRIIEPRDQVAANVERVMELHEQLARQRHGSIEHVVKAQDELSRHQAKSAGLLAAMTKLKELKADIEIAARNIELCLPELLRGSTSGDTEASPFDADLQRAERLAEQFDYDLSFCEAARERAEEAQRLTRLRVDEAVEQGSRVQNRLTVIQSAFIGALLAGLGAIQALNPTIDIAQYLRLPLVAFITGLVLAAPLLILHAFEPYQRVDYLAASVLGAATGWLALALLWGSTPSAWAAVGAAVLGTGLLFLLARRLDSLLARGSAGSERAAPG